MTIDTYLGQLSRAQFADEIGFARVAAHHWREITDFRDVHYITPNRVLGYTRYEWVSGDPEDSTAAVLPVEGPQGQSLDGIECWAPGWSMTATSQSFATTGGRVLCEAIPASETVNGQA